jgi:hypothetical protein
MAKPEAPNEASMHSAADTAFAIIEGQRAIHLVWIASVGFSVLLERRITRARNAPIE